MTHDLITALDNLKESQPKDFFAEASKITEAYCIEHNLPCKRRYTHEELQDAFEEVRAAAVGVLLLPVPAEACTDLGATDRPRSGEFPPTRT